MKDWLAAQLQRLDIRFVLILLFITVSTGHVGYLFANREAAGWGFIGYVLAFAIDVALAISLYEIGYAQERSHKAMALAGFVVACGISGGFNVYYYREFYPGDPVPLSVLLGLAAPVLAAFFALLKARGDVQRAERESSFELEKFRIQQETQRAIAVEIEKEKTKQERELTKRLKLEAEARAKADKETETAAQRLRDQRKALASLGKSAEILLAIREIPGITREGLGKTFDIGLRTVDYHMKKLEENGAVSRNGQGFRILWDESTLELMEGNYAKAND